MRAPPWAVLSIALLLAGALGQARAADTNETLAQFVGNESCMECHDDIFETFQASMHGLTTSRQTPAARYEEQACESCHGPGSVHAEEGDAEHIKVLGKNSPLKAQEKNDSCLPCHARGSTTMWQNSVHDVRGVACTDCHSVHVNRNDARAKSDQRDLCLSCHSQIRPQLTRLSHHPLREEKMTCTACHNVHGTIADHLIEATTVAQKCYECHPQVRGPYLWPHQPVIEDCLICHEPHGATREFLLAARPPYLCQRCHSNVDHAGLLQARNRGQSNQSQYRVLGNTGYYRGCLNCHSAVHGSNHPSGKSLLR